MKSWMNGCCFALAVLFWAAGAQAQAPLPTPRRDPPARRGERVERLRKLGGQVIGALAADPQAAPKPLDVPQLNEGILSLLEPLLTQERALESLHIGFDPAATNFARDTIKLRADARLKHTGWSPNPTQINIELQARMARGDDRAQQALLEGQLHVETEVIPLANRAIARILGRSQQRPPAGDGRPLTADEDYQARLRAKLERTPPLASMDELVDLGIYLAGLRMVVVNDQIDRLKDDLNAAPDERARAALQADLDQVRLARDRMFDVRPRVERDERGRAAALVFSAVDSSLSAGGRMDRLELVLREHEIHLVADGSLLRGVESYALLKPLVMNTLERLQNRDPDTLRLGRGILRDSLNQARPLLFGDAPQAAPDAEALPRPEQLEPVPARPTAPQSNPNNRIRQ